MQRDERKPLRVIQPVTWCGVQKGGPDSPMVCGACPDWKACDEADRCARAGPDTWSAMVPYQREPGA